jgi:hypothetical protein
MSVIGSGGRLGCSNHVERGTCTNRRTVARDKVLNRVLVGLKDRLLAPALVQEFVAAYIAEVNAANRERGTRQAGLQGQVAKLDRQIRNLLELIKDGHGGVAIDPAPKSALVHEQSLFSICPDAGRVAKAAGVSPFRLVWGRVVL